MTKHGLYEAGAVVFWVDPEIGGDGISVPCADPTWSQVSDISDSQFDTVRSGDKLRILFPVALSALMTGTVPQHAFMTRLVFLGGHAFVYGWYVKMFHALCSEKKMLVRRLTEAALTVQMTVWSNPDKSLQAVQSIKLSEAIRVAANVTCDSFITFMDKLVMWQGVGGRGSRAVSVRTAWLPCRERTFGSMAG